MEEVRVLLVSRRLTGENERSIYLRISEIRSLIENLGLNIVCEKTFTVKDGFFGSGQMEEMRAAAEDYGAEEIIVDAFLSPKQEKEIEDTTFLPVYDREAVILSIFRQNAHSREAVLETMMAEAGYMKPRLRRREVSLSQQRGVRGQRGEGEKLIELERRTIDERITFLRHELEKIKKTRRTQQRKRERSRIFSFALAGYTNAGKTTILNAFSSCSAKGEDRLFATLDTTTRLIRLPSGREVLLSDTVGFIRDLPPSLLSAFSSTLEETLRSDAVIVVADASHPDAVNAFRTTMNILSSLNAEDKVRLVVINKIDESADDISLSFLENLPCRTVKTSFLDGRGKDEFLRALDEIAGEGYVTLQLLLPYSSPLFSRLSRNGNIRNTDYREDGILVLAEIPLEEESTYRPFMHKK